ncbi:MAG: folylpolyglutamate synthase/dihydrofolate synthase family protein [Ferruginibacter sp.]
MTYKETIEYLYSQLPMFSRIGAPALKKGLGNIISLCNALGNPQNKFSSIHIAGTNGKGSTSHMLAAILQQAGYKTGLYTSPHLYDFGERIRVNGKKVEEQFVIDFTERTKKISREIEPSFFELTVAMAFEYFARQKIDFAVVETGLGGRLDSTNILSPLLSIITNISFDHMQLLGNTLPEIAAEKAGIIKPGVPVIIGEYNADTKKVFEEKAAATGAPIYYAQDMYRVSAVKSSALKLECNVTDTSNNCTEHFALDLPGLYQTKNLCTVLAAEKILIEKGLNIPEQAEKTALLNTKKITGLHGRWEMISQNPPLITDVGHNEDGIRNITAQLKHDYPKAKKHFVLGFVKDKDLAHVLDLFPKDASFYFSNAHIPRALPHDELKKLAAEKGLAGESFDDVNDAIAAAKKNAADNDVIMVCGSFFIIGEMAGSEL